MKKITWIVSVIAVLAVALLFVLWERYDGSKSLAEDPTEQVLLSGSDSSDSLDPSVPKNLGEMETVDDGLRKKVTNDLPIEPGLSNRVIDPARNRYLNSELIEELRMTPTELSELNNVTSYYEDRFRSIALAAASAKAEGSNKYSISIPASEREGGELTSNYWSELERILGSERLQDGEQQLERRMIDQHPYFFGRSVKVDLEVVPGDESTPNYWKYKEFYQMPGSDFEYMSGSAAHEAGYLQSGSVERRKLALYLDVLSREGLR